MNSNSDTKIVKKTANTNSASAKKNIPNYTLKKVTNNEQLNKSQVSEIDKMDLNKIKESM